MAKMKTFNGYEIVDEWAREQIERINGATTEPTDAKYFDIDANGVIALKAEYRGHPSKTTDPLGVSDNGVSVDGSKHHELPKRIVIPEVINGAAVKALADGMFRNNNAVEEIVLPSTVTVLPPRFGYYTYRLKAIKNTEHITAIGKSAFYKSRIEEALFPNLTSVGDTAFIQCPYLRVADIGKITATTDRLFANCWALEQVKGGENLTTIASLSFYATVSLKEAPFLSLLKVTSFGDYAFLNSRIQFDWSKYPSEAYGTNATPIADNTTDYWSRIIGNRYYKPCENRLVTLLNQIHPLWKDKPLGNTGRTWEFGCATFSALHIHSAFTGKKYATPQEFEDELDGKKAADGTPLLNVWAGYTDGATKLYDGLGYTTKAYTGVLNEEAFQEVLDALANGAYLHISQGTYTDVNVGHAVVAYGVNEIGEVMIADSGAMASQVDVYNEGFTYQIPLQNMTGPDSDIIIVRKQTEG